MKLLTLLLATCFSLPSINGQTMLDIIAPDRQLEREAKSQVATQMGFLKDSLNLSRKEAKIKKFQLELKDWSQFENLEIGEQIDLAKINDNSRIYFFRHSTSRIGRNYSIYFYFNIKGELIDQEVILFMIIP